MTGPTVRPGLVERVAFGIWRARLERAGYQPDMIEIILAADKPTETELADAAAALAASGIEEMRGALEAAITNQAALIGHLSAAGRPDLAGVFESYLDAQRAALFLADGMGGEG